MDDTRRRKFAWMSEKWPLEGGNDTDNWCFKTNGEWYKYPCMLKLIWMKKIHWQDIEHKGDNRVNKCGGIRFGIKHSKTTKCFVDMLIHWVL